MPNHFHVLIRNITDGAISVYMQRVLMAYSKYFNKKYNKTGHVFEGPFRAIHIRDDVQLLHTSAYIHRNPIELSDSKIDYKKYPWSSCPDHLVANRWQGLLLPNIVSDQFKTPASYNSFISSSTAKEHIPLQKVAK